MPANRGREDLRCPFGCRQLHRRQQFSRRSTAYYRTAAGRQKKHRLNASRSNSADSNATVEALSPPVSVTAEAQPSLALPESLEISLEMIERSSVLPYVALLFALIGGRKLTREQLLERLCLRVRQHSLPHLPRREYVAHIVHEQPP